MSAGGKRKPRLPGSVALGLALQRYRELYPEGTVPKEVEARAIQSHSTPDPDYRCSVCYWLKGQVREPLTFFRARVNAHTGDVTVEVALDPTAVSLARLEDNPGRTIS